jgi:hypothetical protein
LAKHFPGLSIPNKPNSEEIELDLDFDAILNVKEEVKEKEESKD